MLYSLVLILIAGALIPPARAGAPAAQEAGQERDVPTRFEISLSKTTYVVGEPVYIDTTLYNDTNRDISGPFVMNLVTGLDVFYRRVGAKYVRYLPNWLAKVRLIDLGGVPQEQIPALGKTEGTQVVFFDSSRDAFVLDKPGEYDFRATFEVPAADGRFARFRSNTVRVRVVAPAGKEAEMVREVSDPDVRGFLEGDLRVNLADPERVRAASVKVAKLAKAGVGPEWMPLIRMRLEEAFNVFSQDEELQSFRSVLGEP
jgi:hypothetical protein